MPSDRLDEFGQLALDDLAEEVGRLLAGRLPRGDVAVVLGLENANGMMDNVNDRWIESMRKEWGVRAPYGFEPRLAS